MDIRVTDNLIQPLRYRLRPSAPLSEAKGPLPPIPVDADGACLAYSDRERDDLAKLLEAAGIGVAVFAEPQPDPTLLASLQGKLSTRSAALAALAAGKPPITLDDLSAKLEKAAADIVILQAKTVVEKPV